MLHDLRKLGLLVASLLPVAAAAQPVPVAAATQPVRAAATAATTAATAAVGSPNTLPPARLGWESPAGPAGDPGDPPPIAWAESNRMVGALAGHAGHLRGEPRAQPRDPAPAAAPRARP